jgi:hypothetical protein
LEKLIAETTCDACDDQSNNIRLVDRRQTVMLMNFHRPPQDGMTACMAPIAASNEAASSSSSARILFKRF